MLGVSDVSLRIEAGGTVALIGPIVSGKLTLLKLAAGLLRPQQGSVLVGGDKLTPENAIALRHHIGYVIQSGGLFPHLSAEANVTLAARYLQKISNGSKNAWQS
jgi:osmoprotectant transport system ATP-binding protein